MSKTLKRPMFRKGGEVMEGIMTGIKPRTNYQNGALGNRVENYRNVLRAATQGASTGPDALTQFLLRTGQNLIGGESAGGTKLQEIVGSTNKPMENYFKDLQRKAQQEKQIGLQAGMLGIKGQQAIDIAKSKAKEQYLKDLSPDRYYGKLVDERTSAAGKLKSFDLATIDLAYPRKTAAFDAYVLPKLKRTKDPKGQQINARLDGFVPYDKKTKEFNYDEMKAGLVYYDLTRKVFIERVPPSENDEGGYFTYSPSTYERTKLRGLES